MGGGVFAKRNIYEGEQMIPTIDVKGTGDNIRNRMQQKGITPKGVQNRLGLSSVQAIYKWFYGHNLPTIDNLLILSDMLGSKIDDLLEVVR